MQMPKNKTTATIVLLLMFAMAISLVALPTANAQTTKKSYAFIGALPNPVGVNQEVLLHVGITEALTSTLYAWEGLSVTITRPDGVIETISGINTDSTGATGRVYVPTMAGNYTLQTNFPQQVYKYNNYTYLASTSEKLTLVVQEEPIKYYPGHPLPTEYWTRPIDAQLREWYTISESWLASTANNFAPYNQYAPDTAHILWTTPLTTGGVVGGDLGDPTIEALGYHAFECGDAYEGKWSQRFILAGKLYYQKYAGSDAYKEYVCVDLHTGEELWSKVFLNNLTLSRGQLMYWDTYDYHGVYDYLWATGNTVTRDVVLGLNSSYGTIWCAFDPFTGDYVATMHNMPSGTFTYGPKGEMLYYTFNMGTQTAQQTGWMTLWNSSNIPTILSSRVYGSMGWGQWKLMGRLINATGPAGVTLGGQPYTAPTTPLGLNGYQWNVTIPKGLPGSVGAVKYGDRAIGMSVTTSRVITWGFSLEPGKEGQLLFNTTWQAPAEWVAGNVSISHTATSLVDEERVRVLWAKETRKLYGFSLETGEFLWETETPEDYLNIYSKDTKIAYGKVFSTGCSGIVYCYNATTGKLLWKYHATDTYSEILWANQWWMGIEFICDGKIYIAHEEHSPIDPKPRGAPFICVNATTGEEIWRIDGAFRQTHWGGIAIIGDSIIATMDTYDQRVYAIGKGPSATTVTAPDIGVPLGKSVLVRGTVTDISPGTKEYALTARFPNGVPAVADENMSDWMLYVYKQFARPADAVGVEVVLSVLDPNNNYYEVGRATSDASGFFSCAFTPEVPGKYTVFASFAGSGAYYGSFAETAINVEEALQPTPAPTPTPIPTSEMYFVPAVSGIIVAIVVVGVLLALLLLRKRP